MKRIWITAMVTFLLIGSALPTWADLFDDALDALSNNNLQAASLDHLGQALRGGLAAGYPQYTPGPTPLHGFAISTPCGSFSFGQAWSTTSPACSIPRPSSPASRPPPPA